MGVIWQGGEEIYGRAGKWGFEVGGVLELESFVYFGDDYALRGQIYALWR